MPFPAETWTIVPKNRARRTKSMPSGSKKILLEAISGYSCRPVSPVVNDSIEHSVHRTCTTQSNQCSHDFRQRATPESYPCSHTLDGSGKLTTRTEKMLLKRSKNLLRLAAMA